MKEKESNWHTVSRSIPPKTISHLHILLTAQIKLTYRTLGQKLPEIDSMELHASLPPGFLSCKSIFSQHHLSGATRHMFNGLSCWHLWEQDLCSAVDTAQATYFHTYFIIKSYTLGNPVENQCFIDKCNHSSCGKDTVKCEVMFWHHFQWTSLNKLFILQYC